MFDDLTTLERVMMWSGLAVVVLIVFCHEIIAEGKARGITYDLREMRRVRSLRDQARQLVDNLTEIANSQMTADERADVEVALEEAKLALQRHSQRYAALMRGGAHT